jgi:hypothetical protein
MTAPTHNGNCRIPMNNSAIWHYDSWEWEIRNEIKIYREITLYNNTQSVFFLCVLLHDFCESKLNNEIEEKQLFLLRVGRSFCPLVNCSYAEIFEAAFFVSG